MKLTEIDFFDNVRSVVNSLRIVIALCEEKALLEGSGIHKLNIHGHVTNTPYAGRVLYKKIQTTSEILGKISAVVSENIILLGLIQFSETGNFQNNDE